MGSYYREHVSYPNIAAGPYPPNIVSTPDNVGNNITDVNDAPSAAPQDNADPRECSVKGCQVMLQPGYPHKMCEECRGRHRVYAMTKRAKRKMEKALINTQNGQPVVWMPPDDAVHQDGPAQTSEAGPSHQYQVAQIEDTTPPPFDFSQAWDPSAIDPRLFSQASELAGALSLPPAPQHPVDHNLFANDDESLRQSSDTAGQSAAPPPPPPAPEIHPVLAEVLKAVPGLHLPTRVTSGPTVPVHPSTSSVDGPLPPRFCSIKGCKTLIAGNSFFKMCEPCRDRYRNYGTTKRAKWKREKEIAVAELQKVRIEEDVRRVAQGLPPLPIEPDPWQEYDPGTNDDQVRDPDLSVVDASTTPSVVVETGGGSESPTPLTQRMCTVSHCREVLAGDYQYLRCERHRVQNRHHSKLKRVRDKEVKAQVYDGWAAAVGARAQSTVTSVDETGEGHPDAATGLPDIVADMALAFSSIDDELRDGSLDPDYSELVAEGLPVPAKQQAEVEGEGEEETPLGEPSSGLPPAARGTRRTNHVCSIRTCANLLSPSNPWKMCDLCRSRDRAGRRIKAMRDNGLIPPEIAEGKIVEVKNEVEGREKGKGKGKKGKRKGKGKGKGEREKEAGTQPKTKTKGKGRGQKNQADEPAEGQGEVGEEDESDTSSEVKVLQQPEATRTDVDVSLVPTVLHGSPSDAGQSAFNTETVLDHPSLVFMEPMLGQMASTLQQHLAQTEGGESIAPDAAQPSDDHQDVVQVMNPIPEASTTAPTPDPETLLPKKRGRKKSNKVKAPSQLEQNSTAADVPQPSSDPSQLASNSPDTHTNNVEPTSPTLISSAAGTSQVTPAPPYHPPPPSGSPPYSYYALPYMTPYAPLSSYPYGYQSPPKGSYPPHAPPPIYQSPYGPYHYPYPYTGPPYPHHVQSYGPSAIAAPYPPPLQDYTSSERLPSSPVQLYPPPIQPYPYVHPWSPPPPPPLQQHQELQQPQHPEQRQQQPQSNPQPQKPQQPEPPVQPPVSSPTFSSKSPKSTTTTSASPSASQEQHNDRARKPTTFIVRTSETYENPQMYASFMMKRKRDDDVDYLSPNKRAELEMSGTFSTWRLPSSNTTALVPDASPENVQFVQTFPEVMNVDVAESPAQETVHCGNATCTRIVIGGKSGSFCDRCRERLKKKQAKAKHRFKLEPKILLGRVAGG